MPKPHNILVLLALTVAPACGEDSATTGFTGATEAITTTSAADPTTGTTTTGTTDAPTSTSTGEAPTGGATSTGPLGETTDGTTTTITTGEPGTTDTGTTGITDTGTTGITDTSTGDPGGDTIYAIQDGTIAEGSAVVVEGVIVTAIAPDLSGLFVQEPDGGEYSGIWVAVGKVADLVGLAVGDEVDVLGTTAELAGRTTIDVAAGSVTATGVEGLEVVPEPLLTAIFTKAVLAEPWESVLIRISGAPLAVAGIMNGGELKLADKEVALAVDDFLYDVPADFVAFPGLGEGASFTQVAGVLNADGEFDLFKLAPRRASDLVGYQQP